MRVVLYYLFSCVALLVYGGQVCPFLEELSLLQLGGPLGLAFLLALLARRWLNRWLVQSAALLSQAVRQFQVDFGLFVAVGLLMTFYNMAVYDFPALSGIKLIIGCISLGLYAGTDLALERQWRLNEALARSGSRPLTLEVVSSLADRFARLAAATFILFAIDLVLIIFKDLEWMVTVGEDGLVDAWKLVLIEFLFVVLVLGGLTLNLIASYARNLKRFFDNQTQVLQDVSRGRLDRYVTVSSEDEFGLIATQTNQMIDGLRERNHIKQLFGKLVSPAISRKLLENGEAGLQPGGSRKEVVVLFSDIRDFTARSEQRSPEEVVSDLNLYFKVMVELVHQHGGVVDKFIGDGLMAIFGLDDPQEAADRAVAAALDMQGAIERLNGSLSQPIRVGIGLHFGEVIAGLIGAPERIEFTVIGDTVNVASRLEGLSKELEAAILISGEVRAKLSTVYERLDWQPFGSRLLRGRLQPLDVYGITRFGGFSASGGKASS